MFKHRNIQNIVFVIIFTGWNFLLRFHFSNQIYKNTRSYRHPQPTQTTAKIRTWIFPTSEFDFRTAITDGTMTTVKLEKRSRVKPCPMRLTYPEEEMKRVKMWRECIAIMRQPDIMPVGSILQTPISFADNTPSSYALSLFLFTLPTYLPWPSNRKKDQPSSSTSLQAPTRRNDDERCNLTRVFDETA